MEIKSKGFEYKGFKLGDKVKLRGEESTIIGFDTDNSCDSLFILIEYGSQIGYMVCECDYVDNLIVMEGKENSYYYWFSANDVNKNKLK